MPLNTNPQMEICDGVNHISAWTGKILEPCDCKNEEELK
jgi:hypothetical protein